MTSEALAAELAGLFSLSVAILIRAGELVKEMRRRNLTVRIKSVVFGEYVPKIADGVLAPELVSALADAPKALRALSRLPLADQVRLANGDRLAVVKEAGQTPHMMSAREAFDAGHTYCVLGGRILSPREQSVQIQARAKVATAKPKKAKAPPAPKQEPPSENEIEALIWAMNREIAARGVKPSPRLFVELALKANWGPRR